MTRSEYSLSSLTSPILNSTVDGVNILQFKRNFGDYTLNFPVCLTNSKDFKVNNYSNFYLTGSYLFSDIFPLSGERFKSSDIVTDIKIREQYLSFDKIDITPYIEIGQVRETKNYGVGIFTTTPPTTKFNIEILNDNKCRICYKHPDKIDYYLISDVKNDVFFVNRSELSFDESYINPQDFTYLFSESSNKILFFKTTDIGNYVLVEKDNILVLKQNTSRYIAEPFQITRNIYTVTDTLLNTSFIKYNDNNSINTDESDFNLKNNYLLHRKYSNDGYLTDIVVLKNQVTQLDTFSNSNPLLSGNNYKVYVDGFRDYTSIFQTIPTENSDELELNYTFSTKTYKIAPGSNVFTTPENMYPFTQININDCKFIESGAFPYITPEYADKVYQLSENPTQLENGQHLLCTWLYKNPETNEVLWIDRYYYPDLIEKEEAMQAYSMYVKSPQDEYIESIIQSNSDILDNINQDKFFDKRSDLVFTPDKTYKYRRITSGTTSAPSVTTKCKFPDELIYPVNYYEEINDKNKFTLSFDFNGDASSWIIESERNEIQGGLTITKDGSNITYKYWIYDPVYESYSKYTTSSKIKDLKGNTVVVSVDGVTGESYFSLNNSVLYSFNITPYKYLNKQLLYGDFFFKSGNESVNMVVQPPTELMNLVINNTYTTPEKSVLYPIINGYVEVDPIFINLPSGTRNSTDNIELLQQICSNSTFKSNNIDISIKNISDITDDMKAGMVEYLKTESEAILPSNININNIKFENFK